MTELHHPDSYLAGAATDDSSSPYKQVSGLERAMAHADRACGCPQPCRCPDWVEETEEISPGEHRNGRPHLPDMADVSSS